MIRQTTIRMAMRRNFMAMARQNATKTAFYNTMRYYSAASASATATSTSRPEPAPSFNVDPASPKLAF